MNSILSWPVASHSINLPFSKKSLNFCAFHYGPSFNKSIINQSINQSINHLSWKQHIGESASLLLARQHDGLLTGWLIFMVKILGNHPQIGNHPQVGVKIKNIWNHQLEYVYIYILNIYVHTYQSHGNMYDIHGLLAQILFEFLLQRLGVNKDALTRIHLGADWRWVDESRGDDS